MASENLQRLQDAGFMILAPLPEEYEQVIEALSPEEVEVLISVKRRFDEAGPSAAPEAAPGVSAYTVLLAPPF